MWTIDSHTRKDKDKKENPPTDKKGIFKKEKRNTVSPVAL
jgi:hypothetical protein